MEHSAAPAPTHASGTTRTNAEWLAELGHPARREAALRDLRAYLHRGLRRAVEGRPLGGIDLEDLTQDALVRILDRLHTFRGDSRFTTWAMAVAVRVALTALRRRRFREVQVADPVEPRPAAPDDGGAERALGRRRLLASLRQAIDEALTARQRTAVLGELAGTPSEELAASLQMTRNAFYKLHHDARKRLRTAILQAGFTLEDVRLELQSASDPT